MRRLLTALNESVCTPAGHTGAAVVIVVVVVVVVMGRGRDRGNRGCGGGAVGKLASNGNNEFHQA